MCKIGGSGISGWKCILLGLLVLLLVACRPAHAGRGATVSSPRSGSPPPTANIDNNAEVRHCTVITISLGDRVFFGGNDDYINRDSTYWVDAGGPDHYAAIFFGKPENVQQGFNEVGLAYDANGLPRVPVTSHPGRKPVYGGYASYIIQILQACATVDEVVAWVQEHQWHELMHDQMHFADATGDAVVISAGPDGKVAFTRKAPGDGFLVSTNFNLANPSNGGYPCWRYSRAEEMLGQIRGQDELTKDRVASVMEAVHVEGPSGWTLYSVVADLRLRLVYVYFMFQYDAPLVLSIDHEITQSQPPRPLSELFPEETRQQADRAYQRLVTRSSRCAIAGWAWLGLVAGCLLVLVLLARSRRRGLAYWIPVVAVLGPVGLLAWLMAAGGRRRPVLVETMGHLPPNIVGMVLALQVAARVPEIAQNPGLQLLMVYGLVFALGLLCNQAPLLARLAGRDYVRTALRRLPGALVSTNLALAGLVAIGLPLVNWQVSYCGLGRLVVLQWWALVALGSLVGGLPLLAFHAWATRRGLCTWSALLWGRNQGDEQPAAVSSPPWRQVWGWVVLSFLVLIAGIALGVLGSLLASAR